MTNYIEQATLRIVDEASPSIKSINDALRVLHANLRDFDKKDYLKGISQGARQAAFNLSQLKNMEPIKLTTKTDVSIAKASRTFFLDIKPLAVWSTGFLIHLGKVLTSGLEHRFIEGTSRQNRIQSKFNTINFTAEERSQIEPGLISLRKKRHGVFSPSEILDEFIDSYNLTHNVKSALGLEDTLLSNARTYKSNLGLNNEQAFETARSGIKALEVLGKLKFDSMGNLTATAQQYLEVIQRATLLTGKYLSSSQILTLARNLKMAGRDLSPEGLLYSILQAEGEGTRTGNLVNRLVATLFGKSTKKAMDAEVKYGLGSYDKNKVFHPVEERLLLSNPYEWVAKNLPKALATYHHLDPIKDKGKLQQLMQDPIVISNFVRSVTGNIFSADAMSWIIKEWPMIQKNALGIYKIATSDQRKSYEDKNGLLYLSAVSNSLTELAGTAGNVILNQLIHPLDELQSVLYGLNDWINASTTNLGKLTKLSVSGALLGTGVLGGMYGLKKGFSYLFNFTKFNTATSRLLEAALLLKSFAASSLLKKGKEDSTILNMGAGDAKKKGGSIFKKSRGNRANLGVGGSVLEKSESKLVNFGKGAINLGGKVLKRGFGSVASIGGVIVGGLVIDFIKDRYTTPSASDTAKQARDKEQRRELLDATETIMQNTSLGALAGPAGAAIAGGLTAVYEGVKHWDAIANQLGELVEVFKDHPPSVQELPSDKKYEQTGPTIS